MSSKKYVEINDVDFGIFVEKIVDIRNMYEDSDKSLTCDLGEYNLIIPSQKNFNDIASLMADLENGDNSSLKNYLISDFTDKLVKIAPYEFNYSCFCGFEVEIIGCEQVINKDLYVKFNLGVIMLF